MADQHDEEREWGEELGVLLYGPDWKPTPYEPWKTFPQIEIPTEDERFASTDAQRDRARRESQWAYRVAWARYRVWPLRRKSPYPHLFRTRDNLRHPLKYADSISVLLREYARQKLQKSDSAYLRRIADALGLTVRLSRPMSGGEDGEE